MRNPRFETHATWGTGVTLGRYAQDKGSGGAGGVADSGVARPKGDSRQRPSGALRGSCEAAEPGGETQPGEVSRGFHVPGDSQGARIIEITNCDLKRGPRRAAVSALCLYRARGHYGGYGAEFAKGCRDERFRGAGLCAPARDAGQQPATGGQDRRIGAQAGIARYGDPGGAGGDQGIDGTGGGLTKADRVSPSGVGGPGSRLVRAGSRQEGRRRPPHTPPNVYNDSIHGA